MTESNTNTSTNSDNELILVKDRYRQIKVLGRGSYGEVWLISPLESSITGKNKYPRCVLKRISLNRANDDKKELAAAEREAQLLSSLAHPNIVAYIESFRSRDGYLNIIMAFCEGGDLYTKLKYRKKQLLSEEQIMEWFIQITLALQYLHTRSILHRDLKTQNIFLTKMEIIKLGDLGIAKILDNNGADLATTVIGTPYYMSPEIFSNQPYGQKSDIWALGCCAYEMATLEHAFTAGDISSLVLKIVRGQTPTLPSANVYSKSLIELINSMLDKTADNRPSAQQILQQPYVKQHVSRLFKKIQQRNEANGIAPPTQPPILVASSQDMDRHSMPPIPRPHSAHLCNNEDDLTEKSQSSNPPLSQSRARRLKERTAAATHNEPPPTPPSPAVSNVNSNSSFIDRIRENDTLVRYKREISSSSQTDSIDDQNTSRLGSAARQRRREQRFHPTTSPKEEEHVPPSPAPPPATPPVYNRSISNDSQIDAVEQERKDKRDMKDFLNELDATLRSPVFMSNSDDMSTIYDRTMVSTRRLEERRNVLRETCLKEISPKQLDEILELLDRVSETEIKKRMIEILGEDIYERYSGHIYALKYHESSLFTRQ